MDNAKLEDIWAAEQSILDAVHKVCIENNLRYSLAYGTLLGAVRHKGFIPWDDDIDIMMPREDYEKLIQIWDTAAPEEYILQTEENVDGFENNFAKIRKDHTTFLQFESERTSTRHKGFFIDIFPADRRAPGRIRRKLQYVLFAINLLFNRGYESGTGGAVGFVEKILLKTVRRKNYRKASKRVGKRSRRWNHLTQSPYILPCAIKSCKKYYPADMFDEMQLVGFNGKEYCAVKDVDSVLKLHYGDYKQLPPEEERVWKHHPILIDFEHNYEELVEEGKV